VISWLILFLLFIPTQSGQTILLRELCVLCGVFFVSLHESNKKAQTVLPAALFIFPPHPESLIPWDQRRLHERNRMKMDAM
jgi:hypothetical protein